MDRTHRHLTAVASLALFMWIGVAEAQPTEAERRTAAEALYTQAEELLSRKDYAAACPKLEEVVRLQPAGVGAKTTLADCYEGAGKLASAHAMLREAVSAATNAGQPDRADAAQARASALGPRLSKLTIEVPSELVRESGLSISRDGSNIGSALWNVPIPIDGGTHTIRASLAGRVAFEKTVKVAIERADTKVGIVLPVTTGTPTALPGDVPAHTQGSQTQSADPSPTGVSPVRTAGWVIGGVGLVAAGIGTGVAISGISKTNTASDAAAAANKRRDTAGYAAASSDHRAAVGQTTAGWVTTGIGGAALLTGIIMVVAAPSQKGHAALQVLPSVGIADAGCAVRGVW